MTTPQQPVEYRTIGVRERFHALAPEWDALVRAMPRPSPFFLHAWVDALWRWYGELNEVRVEAAFHGGRLVGAIPLEITRPAPGLRSARFVGRHLSALGDVLLSADAPAEVAPALVARLRESDVDYVDFFGVPENSVLRRAAPEHSFVGIERIDAPVLEMREGWDAVYREKTSPKRRSLHRRRRRQLEELGTFELSVARTADELDDAIEHAFALHDLRWSGRPDGSEFTTPLGKQVHRAAVRAMAELDAARILLMRVDGRPIAFHYYFLLEGRMYVHRLAFDPAYGKYSPGIVATHAAIEAASAEGAWRVEYLGGGERYKIELADRREPLSQLVGLARTPAGRIGAWTTVHLVRLRIRLRESERLHALYGKRVGPVWSALRRRGRS